MMEKRQDKDVAEIFLENARGNVIATKAHHIIWKL